MDIKKMKKVSYDPSEKKVRMDMLKELMQSLDGVMADDLKDVKAKKVTVMAKDDESLKEGLEKAEELVEQKMMPEMDEEEEMESEEDSEDMPMSKEDIQAKIEKLQKKLQMME